MHKIKIEEVVQKAAEKIEAAVTPQQKEAAVEQATAEVAKEATTAQQDSEAKEVEIIMPSNIPLGKIALFGGGAFLLYKLSKKLR